MCARPSCPSRVTPLHQTSCEPKGSQFVRQAGIFQNGRITSAEISCLPRRLDDESRSERCVLFHSLQLAGQETSDVPMARETVQVQLPTIRGRSSAPWTFTKATKPVVTILRTLGMRIIIYIDDILVMAPSREIAQQHTDCLIFLLESLGFTINGRNL